MKKSLNGLMVYCLLTREFTSDAIKSKKEILQIGRILIIGLMWIVALFSVIGLKGNPVVTERVWVIPKLII